MRARHVGLLAAGGVGAWTLGWRLDAHHLRGDELYYRQAALDMLEGQWLTNAQHPPLAKQLMALTHLGLGDTVVADRLPAALAAWVTGLLLALLVWQVGRPGRWTALVGIATALLWWTLPWAPGRTATLESVMTCGLLAAQLAWTLAVTRRDPRWLLVGGALAGLAAAAKLTGALALVGLLPAALLLLRHRPAHTVVPLAAAALVAAGVTWVFPFVPMEGEALRAMTTPVTFQLGHAEAGHTVVVAGQTHHHAPWWTSLWFALQRLGPLAAAGLVLGALVGLARHGARLAPVATTLLGLVVAMSLSPVQLGHYQYVWWPLLLALAGCALAPGHGATRRGPARRWVAPALSAGAALALLPAVALAADHVGAVARTEPSGLTLAPDVLAREVPEGTTITIWSDPWPTQVALPGRRLTTTMPGSLAPRALLVDRSYAARSDAMDPHLWRACRPVPYSEHRVGDLVLFVRQADPHPAFVPDPGCGPLRPTASGGASRPTAPR